MKLRRRRRPQPKQSKAQRRARAMSDGQLLSWASRCTYDIGHELVGFQKDPDERGLIYAERAAGALHAVTVELRERWRSQGLSEAPTGLADLDEVGDIPQSPGMPVQVPRPYR